MRRRGGFDKGFLLLLLIVLILVATGMFLYEHIRTDKVAEDLQKGDPVVIAILVTDTGHLVDWRDTPASQLPVVPDGGTAPADLAGTQVSVQASAAHPQPPVKTSGSGGPAAAHVGTSPSTNPLLFTEVLIINPRTNNVAVMDVPGNVGELIPSQKKITRIDVLFNPDNVDAYLSEISGLLGTAVPFHLEIDIRDVPKLVDLLGGLSMFIANPIDVTNATPMVLLPSGSLVLDGAKVQSYLTYKGSSDTDIEIVSRRQKFVQALLKAIQANTALFGKPGVYALFNDLVSSNLNKRSLVSFVGEVAHLNTDHMIFQRVLGVNRMVDGQELLFPHYNGRLLRETVQQTLATLANPQSMSDQITNAKLQILNGTFISGLAHRTSAIFQSFGYDVVAVGNATKQDYAQTVILDRTGDLAQAQRVASIIKCTDIQLQPSPPAPTATAQAPTAATPTPTAATPTPTAATAAGGASAASVPNDSGADVTIILGKDFDGRYCK